MTADRRRLGVAVTALAVLAFSCSGDSPTASAPSPDVPPATEPQPAAEPPAPEPQPAAEPPAPEPLPPPDPAPEPPPPPEPPPAPEPPPPPEPAPEPPPAPEPIRFGFLTELSGRDAYVNPRSLDGARAAIGEINANGGVLGRAVELVVEDSLSAVEGSVAAYDRIRAEIDALGGLEPYGAAALLDAVTEDEMPTLCPLCGTSDLASGGDFLWGLTAAQATDGVVAAQLARDLGYTRVALLVRQAEPWWEWLDGIVDAFRGAWVNGVGGEITAEVEFVPGFGSYTAQVQQVIEGNPEALFIIAGYGDGDVVISDVIDSGYEGTILVSSDLAADDIAEIAAELPTGRVLGAWVTDDFDSPAYTAFAAAHIEHAGKLPQTGFYEANHYDQYIALALAMTAAGSSDGPVVAAQVPRVLSPPGTKVYSYADGVAALERGEDIDYDGASGSLDMNEEGDLVSPMISVTHNANGVWLQREVIQLDPNLSATATVGSRREGSAATTTWPDFVPTDLEWEPATILTFEEVLNEDIPVYDGPGGNRLTLREGDQSSSGYFGIPLPLVARVVQGSEGDEWAEVELPVRPNGSRGWIRTAGFSWSTVDHHIFVDLSERSLAFFRGDDLLAHTRVIVGKPSTPTPAETGFIIGKLPNHDRQFSVVFGAWILLLSIFSEALDTFGGEPPRVSLHGTHIPTRVGEALTNFEVRMPNEIIEIIAREAPIGTNVRIVE